MFIIPLFIIFNVKDMIFIMIRYFFTFYFINFLFKKHYLFIFVFPFIQQFYQYI